MFRYELHMHSREGSACGVSSIHDMIRRYAQLGYAGAAVTNHFYGGYTRPDRSLPWEEYVAEYSRAYFEGKKTAEELGFHLLFGVEEGYGGGKEFLAYGFEPEFLIQRPFLRGAGVAVWSEELKKIGGFIAYAHPFRVRDYIPDPRSMPDMSLVDGVEVFNYGNSREDNDLAAQVFGNTGTILIAGSDTHADHFDDACGVDLTCEVTTSAELAAQLKKNTHTIYYGERYRK